MSFLNFLLSRTSTNQLKTSYFEKKKEKRKKRKDILISSQTSYYQKHFQPLRP